MANVLSPGKEAVLQKGWLAANRWLILRRLTQAGFLMLFLIGPWYGIWIVKGNLASSLTLDILPLSDPFITLQMLFTGHSTRTDWHNWRSTCI